ncbi:hypothetical protein B0J17DRAFT_685958 [Rhizoctonia solani]|nr:hypothetical protein B0J17DRAFT_685958 [Rhizoctonia solani]
MPGSEANQLSNERPGGIDPKTERGQGAQNIEQGCLGRAVLSFDTIRELQLAIKIGDRLPNKPLKRVRRRALLIAIQYKADGRRDVDHLSSTPNDILRVYKMLGKHGYDASNIRILSERFMDDDMSDPTKENLQLSLEWLVQGAQSGDYRYFHFSGHGEVFKCRSGKGKIARVIPESLAGRKADDTDVVPLASSGLTGETTGDQRGTRIFGQKVPRSELVLYNEAMLTLWKSPSLQHEASMTEEQLDDYNRILDVDLNAVFSQLPPGCTLTTTLDCCHSGRMLNAGHKLAGSGFRGSWNGDSQDPKPRRLGSGYNKLGSYGFRGKSSGNIQVAPPDLAPTDIQPPTILDTPIKGLYSDLFNWFMPPFFNMQVGENATHVDNETQGETDPSGNDIMQTDVDIDFAGNSTIIQQDSDSGLETMWEALSKEEREMDGIKANLISWSGCHQRQNASEHRDNNGGYFTSAFTRVVEEITEMSIGNNPSPSLGQVHALVEYVIY